MESFVSHTASLIEAHREWAGLVVGLLTFGESLILIGMLIPGTTVLLIVGGLVGAGILYPVPVLIGAVIGTIMGDMVSYFVGTRLGRRIFYKWPLNRQRGAVARARLFFKKYGFAAVFFGRFLGPFRATIPVVVGIMGMDWRRFQIANVLSALIWAPLVLSPGWLAARGMARYVEFSEVQWLSLAALVLIGVIVVALVCVRFVLQRRRGAKLPRRVRTAPKE